MRTREIDLQNREFKGESFDKEILTHVNSLYTFGYWLTHDADDAKDLMQETLIKAYKYYSYYEEGTNAKSWLFRIMKNNFLNDKQKKSRVPQLIDVDDMRITLGSSEFNDSLAKETVTGFSDEVVGALNSIPENLKTVFLLKYLHEFKYHEIAEMFNMPIGTVKIWLHRAKKLLKLKIES